MHLCRSRGRARDVVSVETSICAGMGSCCGRWVARLQQVRDGRQPLGGLAAGVMEQASGGASARSTTGGRPEDSQTASRTCAHARAHTHRGRRIAFIARLQCAFRDLPFSLDVFGPSARR